MGNLHETLGINELKSKNNIWKALLAEYLANVLLNFFGCASCVNASGPHGFVLIALTFGLTIFVLVQTIGHVSGGHINPAVTVGMMAVGNISVIKGILYVIVQCLGALSGSAILKGLTPEVVHNNTNLGNTQLSTGFSPVQGFGVEFFLGFVLILVISGVCDPNRPEAKPAAALAIGMAVAVGHLATVNFTGSSMNPARSFGSALIANQWKDHWVYWIGPILGAIAAALIYKHAFAAPKLGPIEILERYTTVADEKELKRLDTRRDENLP